jgi:hypothetical protein
MCILSSWTGGWLQEQLAEAERLVLEGERHVARQRQIVSELGRDGHDTKEAMDLLRRLEAWLALRIADRDRLREELGL